MFRFGCNCAQTKYYNSLEKTRVVAILRGLPEDELLRVADEIYKAGVRVIEFPLSIENNPPIEDTAKTMVKFRKSHPDPELCLGLGTVITRDEVKLAIKYGADFIVSPNFDKKIFGFAKRKGLPMLPGTLTPSEIATVVNAGCTIIKLFPASLTGANYIKSLFLPFGGVKFIPFGSVTLENAVGYMKAGAYGLAVGSSFIKLASEGRWDEIQPNAKEFLALAKAKY